MGDVRSVKRSRRLSVKKSRAAIAKADAKKSRAAVTQADAKVIARLEKARAAIALAKADAKRKEEELMRRRMNDDAKERERAYYEALFTKYREAGGSNFATANILFGRFRDAVLSGEFDTARELLSELKDKLAGFRCLPPFFGESSLHSISEQTLARRIYKLAVFMSVMIEDQEAFEREFSLLRPFYTERRYRHHPSGGEYDTLRLNLLRLLLQNRPADFHTELESLSAAAAQDPYLMTETQIEPGKCHRVFRASGVVNFLFPQTNRTNTSGWRMKECGSSTNRDAKKMLLLLCEQKLMEYIKEYHPDWEMKDGFVVVRERAFDEMSKHGKGMVQLLNQTYRYVADLEDMQGDVETTC